MSTNKIKLSEQSDYGQYNGSSVLGSSGFAITGSAGTFQDTGLEVVLPAAGKYTISGDIRGYLNGGSGSAWWISVKIYNSTDAAYIPDSERIVVLTGTSGVIFQMTCPIQIQDYEVDGSKTLRLHAKRDAVGGGATWTVSIIVSDSDGKTVLNYERTG